MPVEIFYSYAHEDEALRDELEKHLSLLKRQGLIGGWHDRKLSPGQEWQSAIDAHVKSAKIILLLVSPDFLASDYSYDVEMKIALQRHKQHDAVVIPIILRPVDWSGAPFGHLQALPRDAKPVTSWANRDEAFASIAQEIRAVVSSTGSGSHFRRQVEDPKRHRILDAAMPGQIVKGQTTELQTLIRLPSSPGLKGILQADPDAEAGPEDVVSKQFPVTFPRTLTGELEALTAEVTLTAPEFEPPTQTKRFIVPPEQDSEVVPFFLTALRTGKLKVLVELQWEDALRGARRLLTECVADASAIPATRAMHLVQIPVTAKQLDKSPYPQSQASPQPPSRAASEPTLSVRRERPRKTGSKTAWIGVSGTIVAAVIAGVFSLYTDNVTSPLDKTPTLRVRVVDQASGVGLAAAKVSADTENGARVGQTDSEGYIELKLPATDNSIRLMVTRDEYEPAERRVASTVFKDGEIVRLKKQPTAAPNQPITPDPGAKTLDMQNEARPPGTRAPGQESPAQNPGTLERSGETRPAPEVASVPVPPPVVAATPDKPSKKAMPLEEMREIARKVIAELESTRNDSRAKQILKVLNPAVNVGRIRPSALFTNLGTEVENASERELRDAFPEIPSP